MSKIAAREAYGTSLAKLIVENERVVVLDADLTKSTKTVDAQKACPSRHFNMGIAEGNMMTVAAGLATCNKIVFASSFAMFATGRAFEQIRNSIGYPHLNVKICGTHAGITVGEDGASHQAIEDISLMRGIPGMVVIQPCDAYETEQVINAVAAYDGPCYVRLGRSAVESVYEKDYQFEIGKASILKYGSKVAIIATGLMVQEVLNTVSELKKLNIHPTIVNMSTIKPLDEKCVIKLAQEHDVIITCEEHSIIGGLGSAVCEVTATNHPIKVVRIGQKDIFGESGKPNDLLHKYEMDYSAILKCIKNNI